jgi:hypothetical protein
MATQVQAASDESPADSNEETTEETVDDEAPVTGDDVTDDEAPPEDGEPAEDGEEKPEPEAAKALKDMTAEELSKQLSDEQLRRVAQKFANKTMAAARRAEKATDEVTTANTALTGEVKVYKDFVSQLQSEPLTALRRLPGFTTLKAFVQQIIDAGGETAEPKPQDEIAALRKRIDDRDTADRNRASTEAVRASQARVFEALGKDEERFDMVLTDLGRGELWDAIVAYTGKHGRCPDDKVYEMADAIEDRLTGVVSKSKKFARPAQKGTPTAANARTAVSTKGKTITNKSSSAAPALRAYSDDEDERERQINAEMRAAGELTDA